MSTNLKNISEETLEQVTGGKIPHNLTVPDVLCDDCGDAEMLYILEYYENMNIAVISCARCGEGFYWDYKNNDYTGCPFIH